MPVTVQSLVEKVATLLLDTDGVRWPPDELRNHISEAQRRIADIKPSAFTTEITIDLESGATQRLSTDVRYLLDVLYNRTEAQEPVTQASLRDLDTLDPSWRFKNRNAIVRQFVYEPDLHPDLFYVYPAQPDTDTGSVRALVAAIPPEIDDTTETLVIRDIYEPSIIDYVVHKAYLKDNEEPDNSRRSTEAYSRFLASLGISPERNR